MVKSMVYMPAGWDWDEEEVITNTDGTRGTYTGKVGGEINTAPMKLRGSHLLELRKVVDSINKSNAKVARDNGLDVHIYIGDLTVDEIKRIFFLCYWATPVLRKMCKQAVYADEQRYYPAPDLAHYLSACKAQTIEQLSQVFEDNSKKGYARYFVNVASFFVRGTCEFRCFNATKDYDEIVSCILFAYRFIDYALRHTEEDFRNLKDVDTFCRELKVKDNLPDIETAPIYFASVESLNSGNTLHKAISVNGQFARMICESTGDKITSVNPQLYTLESRLLNAGKTVKIYNNDEFNHIIYRMFAGEIVLEYTGNAKVFDKYLSSEPVDHIACALALSKIAKYFREGEYYENELVAILKKLDETMKTFKESAQKIIKTLSTAEYKLGTLNDAIADGGDIFFNYDDYRKNRSAVSCLKSYTDYNEEFAKATTQYYHVEYDLPADTRLFLLSEFEYHVMPKLAKMGKTTLYCTETINNKIVHKSDESATFSFIEPPNELQINDHTKLEIRRVKGSTLLYLQRMYIKKVDKVSSALFAYIVTYDGYVLGGFGFDLPKNSEYDLWLLSDFSTNNNIPRLSKLILLCINSELVKTSLCRSCKRIVETVYTKVYTHNPVSMKYRGLFKKVDQHPNHLVYETALGKSGSLESIVKQYQEIINRKK